MFAKPPGAAHVKTRLAAHIGVDGARQLAAAFLADTWWRLRSVDGLRLVLATTQTEADFPGLPASAERWDQGGGDLGERLERVLRRALRIADVALAIGADSPGLPPDLVRGALAALEGHEAVVGPARDGGFYLLGLRRCPAGVLRDLPWSSEQTCTAAARRLTDFGLEPAITEPWFDVDTVDDLHHLRQSVAPRHAPRTFAALAELDLGG